MQARQLQSVESIHLYLLLEYAARLTVRHYSHLWAERGAEAGGAVAENRAEAVRVELKCRAIRRAEGAREAARVESRPFRRPGSLSGTHIM